MVCSKADNSNQMKMDSGTDNRADQNIDASRAIDILTPEGKTLKLSVGDNTEIRRIKNDCELLCGIPSDLQLIQLQGRDLDNDNTISSLDISDGCTLRVTVPQWWQKFVATCYKGDTQQVRKRIYVKMSQVSREERSFTAAFIAAIKGNHNLMFAAFAGRKINLHSKTKLSGRNLLHAAVSGGSTSCVANILMNGGNALLEAPDNTGETPVKMATNLYGEAGDIVKFLNVYLELHRRETKHSGFSNRYWDNLEKNNNNPEEISLDNEEDNNDENVSQSHEKLSTELEDLHLHQDEPTKTNFTETKFFTNNSNQRYPSVTKVNIEHYDANTRGHNALAVSLEGSSKPDEKQDNNENPINLSCNEQNGGQKSDTGYYSSCNQSIGKDATEMFWNEDLFTQPTTESELTKQELKLGEQTGADAVDDSTNNPSLLFADSSASDRDSGSSRWPKSGRRAQLRKQVFLEQRRKRSTTERPNLEQLLKMGSDSITNESSEKGQTEERKNESRDKEQITESLQKESHAIGASDVINVWQGQENVPAVTFSSNRDPSDTSHSPKPPRRAQLRKKSIIEQRRKRSMVERPNIEILDTGGQNNEGSTSDNLERNAEDTSSGMLEQKTEGNSSINLERNDDGNISVQLEQHVEGSKTMEPLEDESPAARYVLKLWQDQLQARDAEVAALSADECDAGRSPKLLRRAFRRKQAFMAQRRKKSATERPNILKLIKREVNDDENASEDNTEIASEDNREDKPSGAESDVSASRVSQEYASSDIPVVIAAADFSTDVQFLEDKDTHQLSSQLPHSDQDKERIPIRTAQRSVATGPLLDARAKMDTRRISWSSLSGEESSGSDHERVFTEIVAPINSLVKKQRRRRLPLLPNRKIKLPVIKIEDSGISRGSAAFNTPHPPLGRSRSGSTCSEDSVSSIEMSLERTSESETVKSPTVLMNTGPTKDFPVKTRRKSVPNSLFNFNQPIIKTRRDSIHVEEIEEQGLGISPQLRARLKLRDLPRENLPWNEWKTMPRSCSLPGKNSENSAVQYMKEKELAQKNERSVAWNESRRPQTARHGTSRMTFTEWLDNKERLERTRPMTACVRSEQDHKDDVDHERQLEKSNKYQEWLLKKDQEALEEEERLRRKARIKFQRAHKNK